MKLALRIAGEIVFAHSEINAMGIVARAYGISDHTWGYFVEECSQYRLSHGARDDRDGHQLKPFPGAQMTVVPCRRTSS